MCIRDSPDSVSEGFKLLDQMLDIDPNLKVIVLTGQNDQAHALRAVALGAYDFQAKPFDPEVLALTIERAYRLAELQQENRRLQAMTQPDALAGLLTRDAEMLRIGRLIERVAGSGASVLLLGESGTGKEVLAQGLHAASRRSGKFVAINCAAIPETCLESELFGHEKGSFTGAIGERKERAILATGAQAVVTGNIGCLTQIRTHLELLGRPLPLWHTVEVLDAAYR